MIGIKYSRLTPGDKKEIVRERGRCELCGKTDGLVVDHDHDTGHVRGALCGGCNLRIGWLEGLDPNWVALADKYLGSHATALAITNIIQRRFERMTAEWVKELEEVEKRHRQLSGELSKAHERMTELRTQLKAGPSDRIF